MHDYPDRYDVAEVVGHKGRWTQKASLKFMVRWQGYEEVTTEPWASMRLNVKLHDYMRSVGAERYIPKILG